MVDAPHSKCGIEGCVGSSPTEGTMESKAARVRPPIANRMGGKTLSFEYSAFRQAPVPELAYGLDLKSGVCGFDPHQGYK